MTETERKDQPEAALGTLQTEDELSQWHVELVLGLPVIIAANSQEIASVLVPGGIGRLSGANGEHVRHEVAATARLIAAAPELFAALTRAGKIFHSDFCSGEERHHPHCLAVQAAVAKVEGR